MQTCILPDFLGKYKGLWEGFILVAPPFPQYSPHPNISFYFVILGMMSISELLRDPHIDLDEITPSNVFFLKLTLPCYMMAG